MAFPASGTVSAGDDILASQYNNLRLDVMDPTDGHSHDNVSSGKPVEVLSAAPVLVTAYQRYSIISPGAFKAALQNAEFNNAKTHIDSSSDTVAALGVAEVILPHGATIISISAYWYRTDAAAAGSLSLRYTDIAAGGDAEIAAANSNAATGYHVVTTGSLSKQISNSTESYYVQITVDPNDDKTEVKFMGLVIVYTTIIPVP